MPTKRNDSTALAEIREVISDMNDGFQVRCHRRHESLEKGQLDRLDAGLVTEIIEDLLNGKAGELTRDYRRTKLEAARAAIIASPKDRIIDGL